jgi:hypothetical protein
MKEGSKKFGREQKAPLTGEQEAGRRLKIATEALKGVPTFEQMEEAEQVSVLDAANGIVSIIILKHGGRYKTTSSDSSWDVLNNAYMKNAASVPVFAKFRQALGINAARDVYRTIFRMLEAKVETREALDALTRPPADPLKDLSALRTVPGDQKSAGRFRK